MNTTTTLARHGITFPADRIVELCRKYQVVELSVFGSLLRDDFGPESDVDFLVVFQDDDYGPWMEKLQRLEGDLGVLLGREVEVVRSLWLAPEHRRSGHRGGNDRQRGSSEVTSLEQPRCPGNPRPC